MCPPSPHHSQSPYRHCRGPRCPPPRTVPPSKPHGRPGTGGGHSPEVLLSPDRAEGYPSARPPPSTHTKALTRSVLGFFSARSDRPRG